MHIDVNGTRLWFDVDGPALVPDGPEMRPRPTVVLVHGGPGCFDHTYFKPDFERLADVAQVVYLDLRDHGRSAWGDPEAWEYETCADDVRAFCDVLGIERPIVYGHSLGGFIAMLYGARHPGHSGALVLDSTAGRFDVPRMVEEFRRRRRPAGRPRSPRGDRGRGPFPMEGRADAILAHAHPIRHERHRGACERMTFRARPQRPIGGEAS